MDAQTVIQGLIARGMPPHIAQGFAGNFAVESGFDPAINEARPIVPGSRGGFGLAQWTGPRRRHLEEYTSSIGVPVSDMDAQLDFLMQELQGSENRAWQSIQGARDPAEAARLVSEQFLRPGIPHLDRRINSALQFAGMEPQMLPPTVSSQSQQQPQGLFGGIRNMFGGSQRQPDPNAGSNTDPFANLSRSQRTMLGFAALRDAAASLEGRDSSFFNEALGGFEAARERERLRAQGDMANRVNALQSLAALQQQAAIFAASGMPIPTALQQAIDLTTQMAVPAGGAPAGGMGGAMPTPVDFTGGVMPAGVPTGPQGDIGAPQTGVMYEPGSAVPQPYDGAPEPVSPPAAPADPMAELDRREAELLAQINAVVALEGNPRGLELQLADINRQREELGAQQVSEQEAQQEIESAAGRAETVVIPETAAAMDFLVSGFDDQGNPVFNPALVTRAGRLMSGALESPEYQSFVGALETLRVDTLIDTLQNVTAGALSDAEREAFSAAQGQLDPRNPIGTYRALQRMQRIAEDAIARAGRQGETSTAPTVTWD